MTGRERFCRVFDFRKADRPPRWETPAFWPQAVREWVQQGGMPDGADPMEHYGIEPRPVLPGNTGFTYIPFVPPFEPALLEKNGAVEVRRDSQGRVFRTFEDGSSMPQWLRFPVESPQDWQRDVRARLDPAAHDYGDLEQQAPHFRDNPDPNGLMLCGLYAFWRNLWGEERLAYAFYDHPDTLFDQARVWLECNAALASKILPLCRADYVMLHEDMAFKTAPLIGPETFRRFMLPFYRELIGHLRALGQTRFMVDSDGNNLVLLPLFIEAGVRGLYSFEAAAGNDIREVRREFPGFMIWGGLDKRVLLGGADDVRREIEAKVPAVWESGGFIPALDHATPPCPQGNWELFLELIRAHFPSE